MKGFIIIILLSISVGALAQSERKFIREGNKQYKDGKFNEAENSYRNATGLKPNSLEAAFNTANSLYKQGKYADAAAMYDTLTKWKIKEDRLADAYYNLGNSYIKANKIQEGINAYKSSLKIRPNDRDTKFNLSFAQRLLKKDKSENNDSNDGPEPSAYAKKIKKQADELVSQRKYSEAYQLMDNLLKKDNTASSYQAYIKRLKDVVEINKI